MLACHEIQTTPTATFTWGTDVFGNTIATATFAEPADRLEITSLAEVDLRSAAWPVFDISASAITYPFHYEDQELKDLGGLRDVQYPDPTGEFLAWVKAFVMVGSTDTLSLLKDLSAGVSNVITYRIREEEGTQSPLETLSLCSGTCRDFAVLLAEAARILGFGARIVSGYLYNPGQTLIGSHDSGSTHAWTDVYLPGAGWITFDPTNRSLGGANLIPVAVVRDIAKSAPISGGFTGPADAFNSMTVSVEIALL
jgi:transglutaminase-like putative cysteine protease